MIIGTAKAVAATITTMAVVATTITVVAATTITTAVAVTTITTTVAVATKHKKEAVERLPFFYCFITINMKKIIYAQIVISYHL